MTLSIGIVGLLPEQLQHLKRRYPHIDLEGLDRDREKDVATFATKFPRVILTTRFTSHNATYAIPAHKRVMGLNSVSAIGRYLESLQREPDHAVTFMKSIGKVPETPPHTLVFITGEGPHDYSRALQEANPGDTIRFEIDRRLDAEKVRTSLSNSRSYNLRQYEIKTKIAGHGISADNNPYSDICVVSVKDQTAAQYRASLEAQPDLADVAVPQPVEAAPPEPAEYASEVRDLWRATFIARQAGHSLEQAAADADRAVDFYRKRFPVL